MPEQRKNTTSEQSQLDKFKKAAREHEADESAKRWDERLGKLVKAKPKPDEAKGD